MMPAHPSRDSVPPSTIDTILRLRAEGCSYHIIAAQLNRRQMTSARGGRWFAASVFRLVRRSEPPLSDIRHHTRGDTLAQQRSVQAGVAPADAGV